MTPLEKADNLFTTYVFKGAETKQIAIESALIVVDEILEVLYSLKLGNALSEEIEYWEQVKHELTKQQEQ
jgi:hypothetical protein